MKSVETKKNYLDKLEQEEEYINLLYSLIGDIQNEIEESIRNGEWYQKITYEFIDGNDYDEETFYKLIDDIDVVEDFKYEGFKIAIQFNNDYTLDYYIAVDTDVNDGHLDYNLMDKLLANDYLQDIEVVRKYIKMFNQYNTVLSNDDEIIVIDNEQKAKVTFFESGWFKWEHTIERIDK